MLKIRRVYDENSRLMAMSYRQPYGELLMDRGITIGEEYCRYRGWLMVCSSLRMMSNDEIVERDGIENLGRLKGLYGMDYMMGMEGRLGKMLGIGWLRRCIPMRYEDEEMSCRRYGEGKYLYIFTDMRRAVLRPWTGRRYMTEVSKEYKRGIRWDNRKRKKDDDREEKREGIGIVDMAGMERMIREMREGNNY